MTTSTALAPTASLATPRVRKFVEGLLPLFGASAKIEAFFLCEPGTHLVYQGENKWVEANWGVDIIGDRYNEQDMIIEGSVSKQIHIGDASVTPYSNRKIWIKLWIFARVMR